MGTFGEKKRERETERSTQERERKKERRCKRHNRANFILKSDSNKIMLHGGGGQNYIVLINFN